MVEKMQAFGIDVVLRRENSVRIGNTFQLLYKGSPGEDLNKVMFNCVVMLLSEADMGIKISWPTLFSFYPSFTRKP